MRSGGGGGIGLIRGGVRGGMALLESYSIARVSSQLGILQDRWKYTHVPAKQEY